MATMNRYTIKQIADLAGVSRRTLHFYDEKGVLTPSSIGDNGYRFYDDDSLLQLQQILFYRELGLELEQIKQILNSSDFDMVTALQSHRQKLLDKIKHLQTLVQTVDTTVMHLIGEIDMSKKSIFEGLSDAKEAEYEKEAINQWGDDAAQSIKLWKSYSADQKEAIMQEGNQIYREIAANMDKGEDSPEVQALLVRWHQHLRYFYEPSIEMLGGLGNMYHDQPDFNANFTKMHPELPAFLKKAITLYVNKLETK